MSERRLQSVPYRILYSGMMIPGMSLGTYDLGDTKEQQAKAVYEAVNRGFRMIDCAEIYGNETIVGGALQRIIQEGRITRDELFISSKLRSDQHGDVFSACKESLKRLQLDYLDLYIIQWPFRVVTDNTQNGEPERRTEPFSPVEFLSTWKKCERLVESGLVRYIGMSNMTIAKLESVLQFCKIPPAVLEMELHPCFQQQELYTYATDHHIVPIGLCPIGTVLWSDKTDIKPGSDMEHPIIQKIADAHNVAPSIVCIKWAIQRGQIPLISAGKAIQWINSIEESLQLSLSNEEMESIKTIEQSVRLIKGDKFLWSGAKDWTVLWDMEGVISR